MKERYTNATAEKTFGKVRVTMFVAETHTEVPDVAFGMETIGGEDYKYFSLQDGMTIHVEEYWSDSLPVEDWFEAMDFLKPQMELWAEAQREEFERIMEEESMSNLSGEEVTILAPTLEETEAAVEQLVAEGRVEKIWDEDEQVWKYFLAQFLHKYPLYCGQRVIYRIIWYRR